MLISTLCEKVVVDISDGAKIGYVDDVFFDEHTAAIKTLVIYGRPRLAAMFSKRADTEIPWENVEVIGPDTILVKFKS